MSLDHPCKETCSGWEQGFEKGAEQLATVTKERDEARAELEESARLHGIGSNREARLMAQVEEMRKECAHLRAALYKILDLHVHSLECDISMDDCVYTLQESYAYEAIQADSKNYARSAKC